MPATIRDLAKHCGLSVSAVSKALNGYSDISDATRAAVQRAARELDYHPNAHARALKSGRSYNLGVLFSDDSQSGLTHPFFSVVLEHFKKEAEKSGYDITFIGHRMGEGRFTFLDHCRYREVDGVCVACIHFEDEEVQRLAQSDLPLVSIDHAFENRLCVCSDNTEGMRQLVQYVYRQGHRKIAYIHGPSSTVSNVRLAAFYHTMEQLQAPVPDRYIGQCGYTNPQNAYEATKHMLDQADAPTCILLCDDFSVTGAMRAAQKAGLRVPEDLSIAGFDGIDQMQNFYPRLTTIRQDAAALGIESARRLIALIEQPDQVQMGLCTIPCTLIPGQTVAAPARK
ncbi:MAG: LacI family DNA-binding transcriptional regulator [Clostridia bacterium]|nr:LacI family DNA-binding transcriptional regulator [Clostridia bacterium]